MSYKSRFNPEIEFNEKQWIISVINTGNGTIGKLTGHSAIIVEGVESKAPSFHSKLFVGFYDIRAALYDEPSSSIDINPKGYISSITTDEQDDYRAGLDYSKFQAVSAAVDVVKAKAMIASIKDDYLITDNANKGIGKHLPYQFVGMDAIFSNADAGHNCASWCADKLEIAGIGNGSGKKPEMLAGGSCVLS